jgi:hypothetical protein
MSPVGAPLATVRPPPAATLTTCPETLTAMLAPIVIAASTAMASVEI